MNKIAFCLLMMTMIVGYAPEKEIVPYTYKMIPGRIIPTVIVDGVEKLKSTCPVCRHENEFAENEKLIELWSGGKYRLESCRKCGVVYDVMVGRGE